jgi:hypothetical protein
MRKVEKLSRARRSTGCVFKSFFFCWVERANEEKIMYLGQGQCVSEQHRDPVSFFAQQNEFVINDVIFT